MRTALSALRTGFWSVAAALALSTPSRVRADAAPPSGDTVAERSDLSAETDCQTERPRKDVVSTALGTTAALIPGVVVHGAGHMVAGDSKTGLRLLALEGAGLGVLATGFVPIVLSGASRRLIGPAVALSAAGAGLFVISFLADVYGVLAPAGGLGAPLRIAPSLETAIGYRYVYNPVFSYRHFMVQEIDYRSGPWRLHPSAWFAMDDTNSRLRAHVAYRLTGPRPLGGPAARDGSFFDIAGAITRHAFTSDRFATTTGEIAVAGRLDMARLGPSLQGSFAEMSLGWALQAYSYRIRGTTADVGELLLARFGYGIYVGWPGSPRGEIAVYYDHRHDDFAAGLKIPGLGSGVIGHFGAEARVFLTHQWGVAADAAFGSAYVTGLSILYRHGDAL